MKLVAAVTLTTSVGFFLSGCHQQLPTSHDTAQLNAKEFQRTSLTPVRERLLTNFEYERTMEALLDTELSLSARLPPDYRVNGFTRHGQAPLSSARAWKMSELSKELARDYVKKHAKELDCTLTESTASSAAADTNPCFEKFLNSFGTRALRRPLHRDEQDSLRRLLTQAQEFEGDYLSSLPWIVSALLQSPSLLYVSELGRPTETEGVHLLEPYEIASVLAYTITGGPPDPPLLLAAKSDELYAPAAREAHARRLLAQSETRHQFRRFIAEWLEIDELESTSKDTDISRRYESLKSKMLAETNAYTDEVLVNRGGTLSAFLNGGFLSVDPNLARYYGLDAWGPRVPSQASGRVGLLQHASFLSAHALPNRTSPIQRGDFVLRRLLCVELPRPEELGIETVMPTPVKSKTTRELFSAHVNNTGCAACHDAIDPLGYSFENFDAAGQYRTTQNGQKIDSSGHFRLEGHDQELRDSVDLARWLSQEPVAELCFQRYAISFFAADERPEFSSSFAKWAKSLDATSRASLTESLIAFTRSNLFVFRGAKRETEQEHDAAPH